MGKQESTWCVDGKLLTSRLLLGTARYPSLAILAEAVAAAKTEVLTVSVRRELAGGEGDDVVDNPFWRTIESLGCHLLPNTAGCRSADEAVMMAEMAREIFQTNWIKLEVTGDDYTLQPDPFALVSAARRLVAAGFVVWPYCTDDLILCRQLLEVGCPLLMPWAAPIGSGQGVLNPYGLDTLRQRLPDATLLIDAGLGAPSHAAQVMEMGFDAVLLNTAVSLANDPVLMADAFARAVEGGHKAYGAGLMPKRQFAQPSTPPLDQPFWQTK